MKSIQVEEEVTQTFYMSIQKMLRFWIILLIAINVGYQFNDIFINPKSVKSVNVNILYSVNSVFTMSLISISFKSKYSEKLMFVAFILT